MNVLIEISISKEIAEDERSIEQVRADERDRAKAALSDLLDDGYSIVLNTVVNR